ncbi:SCA7, zinc-binding domain-containing protein [Sporodiniella umbellata]|nr:SCA7, zinc-binding domain-containing protein [Sporodiniella umbellata]
MSTIHRFSDSEESDTKTVNDLKKAKKIKQRKREVPLNLDRQCGVVVSPGSEPCSRAITCKIHSVGAKRAVTGRSQSFKDLVAMYQKKGIGRPHVPGGHSQEAHSLNNGPSITSKEEGKATEEQENHVDEATDDVDSDEETQSIYQALKNSRPRPLGERQVFFVQRKRKYAKIRDILLDAMTPKSSTSQCQMPHI